MSDRVGVSVDDGEGAVVEPDPDLVGPGYGEDSVRLVSGMEVMNASFSVSMTSTLGPIAGEAVALPRSAR